MRIVLFLAALMTAKFAFAGQRVFDCKATALSHHPDLAQAEINIEKNPYILFIDGLKDWSLSVGDVSYTTLDLNGPALYKEASSVSNVEVSYDFWVEMSSEFQLVINVMDYTAKAYWWGLGEATPIGDFQCEVTEK